MGRPSPKYTAEFKRRAAGLYRERGCTYAELAREPGCDAGGISDRVERAGAAGAAPDRNPFQMAEEHAHELRHLPRPLIALQLRIGKRNILVSHRLQRHLAIEVQQLPLGR